MEDVEYRIFIVSVLIIAGGLVNVELAPGVEYSGIISLYCYFSVRDIPWSIITVTAEWHLNPACIAAHAIKCLTCRVSHCQTVNDEGIVMESFGQ